MRSDLAQVLIERPRYSSRFGYRRQRRAGRRGAVDAQPQFEAIHRRAAARDKYSSDLFGPLKRFLNSNVGRPWDKVFSEICKHARLDNVAQQHLRRHVFDFVETSVQLIDGVPCHGSGYWVGRPLSRRNQLYVCPRTGLLRRTRRKPKQRGIGNRITVGKQLQYHRIDGVWYEVALRKIPEECDGCVDAVVGKLVSRIARQQLIDKYGFESYALSMRRLKQRETKRLMREFGHRGKK